MGWKGSSSHPQTVIGSNIDKVMRDADCDVVVLRGENFNKVRDIFIPIANPQQARLMLEVGEIFEKEKGSGLQFYHMISPAMNKDKKAKQERIEELKEGLTELDLDPDVKEEAQRKIKIDVTDSIVSRIIDLSAKHDLTVIGAAREGWFQKLVAGSRSEQIAKLTKGRLILVKQRRTVIHSGFLDVIEFFRSKEPESISQ